MQQAQQPLRRKRKRKQIQCSDSLKEMIRYTSRKSNFKDLHKHLCTLDTFIGMDSVKKAVVQQIQFILSNNNSTDGHFLNCVLSGPPGCGKTSLAEVLFNIWMSLDLFESDNFAILHRSDFVGNFMGTTANKSKKVLEKNKNGVIFIDEAYSLLAGKQDEYGKEALDVINSFLSEEKGKTVMIIAGYQQDLEDSFFMSNKGLERRFNWKFNIDAYSADQLYQIFLRQLEEYTWKCEKACKKLFHTHYSKFKHFGGDTENIAFKAKLEFSKTNWKRKNVQKILTYEHVEKAIQQHFKEEKHNYHNLYI